VGFAGAASSLMFFGHNVCCYLFVRSARSPVARRRFACSTPPSRPVYRGSPTGAPRPVWYCRRTRSSARRRA